MQINGVSCSTEGFSINSTYELFYKLVAQTFTQVPASRIKPIMLGMGLDTVGNKDNNND